jgi:hypothetical protein
LVLLQAFDGEKKVADYGLTEASFWVQLRDLPMKGMNEETATRIGKAMGVLEEIDIPDNGFTWGEFMRIRVRMDITKPLLRRKLVKLGKDPPIWISLRYEKLPTFCYKCGRLGHSDRECREQQWKEASKGGDVMAYGPWLRAPIGRRKTGAVTVEGTKSTRMPASTGKPHHPIPKPHPENQLPLVHGGGSSPITPLINAEVNVDERNTETDMEQLDLRDVTAVVTEVIEDTNNEVTTENMGYKSQKETNNVVNGSPNIAIAIEEQSMPTPPSFKDTLLTKVNLLNKGHNGLSVPLNDGPNIAQNGIGQRKWKRTAHDRAQVDTKSISACSNSSFLVKQEDIKASKRKLLEVANGDPMNHVEKKHKAVIEVFSENQFLNPTVEAVNQPCRQQ